MPRRRWRIAWLLGIGVLVNYFRPRQSLRLARRADRGVRHLRCRLRLSLRAPTTGPTPCASCPSASFSTNSACGAWAASAHFCGAWPRLARAARAQLWADSLARDSCSAWAKRRPFRPTPKPIGLWFPPHERSLATSLFDAAAKFASAIGVPLIGIVLIHAGWRWSFAFTGAISFAYFLLLLARLSRPGRRPELDAKSSAATSKPRGCSQPRRARRRGTRIARCRPALRSARCSAWRSALALTTTSFICCSIGCRAIFVFALHIDLLHSFALHQRAVALRHA